MYLIFLIFGLVKEDSDEPVNEEYASVVKSKSKKVHYKGKSFLSWVVTYLVTPKFVLKYYR